MPLGAPLGAGIAAVSQVLRPVLPPASVVVQPMAPPTQQSLMDEPPSKKAKTEDSLVPERQWLGAHPVSLCASSNLYSVIVVLSCCIHYTSHRNRAATC